MTPRRDADFLVFSVVDADPDTAALIANTYAEEYTRYRRELDSSALTELLSQLKLRIAEVAAKPEGEKSVLYSSLVDQEQELRTLQALQANTFLIKPADGGTQIQPTPVRSGILGAFLGLLLGIGFAFLWESLDRRVRNEQELERLLGLPLLGRVGRRSRRDSQRHPIVMLDEPASVTAELFRTLRTNLDLVSVDRKAQTIMVTSALEAEGKTTTLANLAVAYARTGRRVTLVDLDLRRPSLAKMFRLDQSPGLTDVAVGAANLEDALQTVALRTVLPAPQRPSANGRRHSSVGGSNGRGSNSGSLSVLSSGALPPNPGEFVGTGAVAKVLEDVLRRSDIVLVDAPPLLAVGDAIVLSERVDALFIVSRLKLLERPAVQEVARILESCPAEKLGFVVTDADFYQTHGYAVYGHMTQQPERDVVRLESGAVDR